MAETFVNRARVIMARVKDDASPLDSKAPGSLIIKYGNAFVNVFATHLLKNSDGDPVNISTISNEDKGEIYINELRKFHKRVLRDSRIFDKQNQAKITEDAAIDSEFPGDFGIIREIPVNNGTIR